MRPVSHVGPPAPSVLPHRVPAMRRPVTRVSATIATAVVIALAALASSVLAIEPVYWRTRVFYIPYRASDVFSPTLEKVQLLVSRDGASEWAVLQEAQPHVRGFTYHAPVDGDYSFALRTVDRQGAVSPTTVAQPQLRVIVDTAPPALTLTAAPDPAGRLLIRYEARDIALKPETLRLEAQSGATWERIATGPPEASQPDRLLGQVAWKPTSGGTVVRLRAIVDDRAGNQFTATAEASLIGPTPTLAPTGPQLVAASPSATRPAVEWPAASSPAAPPASAAPSVAPSTVQPPPPLWSEPRTPAQLVADGGTPPPSAASTNSPANPFGPPPLLTGPPLSPAAAPSPAATPSPASSGGAGSPWTGAPPPPADASGPRWVNSLTFDVDYDLHIVGPWGVSKVELWATRDEGREWVRFGADDDNRSPIRITVPAAGVYGFRLVVNGANGAAAPTPASGQPPELVIGVDLEQPQAELQAAELGQGPMADHLLIRWTGADANLAARPVSLFFSDQPQGPWSTIATDVDNSGKYAWPLLRQVPERLYLRLEIRDKAGNVAVRGSTAPVELKLPQPTGTFRNVRPVEADPSRFRTAGALFPAPQ